MRWILHKHTHKESEWVRETWWQRWKEGRQSSMNEWKVAQTESPHVWQRKVFRKSTSIYIQVSDYLNIYIDVRKKQKKGTITWKMNGRVSEDDWEKEDVLTKKKIHKGLWKIDFILFFFLHPPRLSLTHMLLGFLFLAHYVMCLWSIPFVHVM